MKNIDDKIKESRDYIKTKPEKDSSYIYQKALNSEPEKKPSFYFRYSKAIRFAALILIVCSVFTAGFFVSLATNKVERSVQYYKYTNTGKVKVNYQNDEEIKVPSSFSNFESKEEVLDYLKEHKSSKTVNGNIVLDSSPQYETAADESLSDSYKTNTQLENVDEADIVKVCGNHIFFLPNVSEDENKKLMVFTEENNELNTSFVIEYALNEEILKEYDNYTLVSATETIPNDLYVTDKYVVVRIDKYSYKYLNPKSDKYKSYKKYDYVYSSCFQILDIDTLNIVTTIETAGNNVSTRLIDNTLYVVNNYFDFMNNLMDYYYPYVLVGNDSYVPLAQNIYYSNNTDLSSYVSVYKILLSDEITVSDIHVLTSSIENIYTSEKNIYLIESYNNVINNEDDYQIKYQSSTVTVINIENGLSISGSFVVRGNINDKYWIDEKDDYVRVVSTGIEWKNYYYDQKYIYDTESKRFNQLSIFKKTKDGYNLVSSISDGLGKPGEQVKSARFNSDVVTIVTFKNTDPLYYVDIRNPENPIITSSLEITGYGVYQHPYNDKYIISFGYEGDTTFSYKITLFDVSDKNNIKQVGNSIIMNRFSLYSSYHFTIDVLSNPKSLFVNDEKGIFGFASYGSDKDNNERYIFSKYYILTIDEESENPLKLTQIADYKKASNNYSIDNTEYQRLVYIGDNYYLLGENNVICYKLENNELKETKRLNNTIKEISE